MNGLKRKKVASLIALALCLAFAMISVFAFAACDETEASGEKVGSVYDDPDEHYSVTSSNDGSKIIETVYVENGNAEIIDGFDDNGVATCAFRYDECSICGGECEGHEMHLTLGGGVYDFYPYFVTIDATSDNRENSDMQVSLIFDEEPEKKDNFVNMGPLFYEIGSRSGEALDIKSIELLQDYTYILRGYQAYRKEYVADYALEEVETSTDTVKIYGIENEYETFGHLILSIVASGAYTYEINFIEGELWEGLLTDLDTAAQEHQDDLQVVESENDVFEPSGDADENGVTEGIYYYSDYRCTCMRSECAGHLKYRSAGGGYYDFYPYIVPLTLTDENGSADINSKLQVSYVFDEEPEYTVPYYSSYPVQIEIASLTGEEIRFSKIEFRYKANYSVLSDGTLEVRILDGSGHIERVTTSTATAKTYEIVDSLGGEFGGTLSTEFIFVTTEGDVYTGDFYTVTDSDILKAIEDGEYELHY